MFIKWIQVLYKQPEAVMQTNGLFSEYFAFGRETSQGSSITPLLFCLAIEPLAAAIRGRFIFQALLLEGVVHKLMLYAADILLSPPEPSRSILINCFSKFSGYRVNWSSSESLPLTDHCPIIAFQPGVFQWHKQVIPGYFISSPVKRPS